MAMKLKTRVPDRLVTVSSNDSTAATLLSKLTSSDNSLTFAELNDGANEQLDLKAAATGAAVQKYDEWVKCTQAIPAPPAGGNIILDTRDWRGMLLHISCMGYPGGGGAGTVAAANAAEWDTPTPGTTTRVEHFGANYAGADVQLHFAGAGVNGTASINLRGGTGQLYLVVGAFTAEFQARFIVQGFAKKSVPDRTA